MKKSDFISDEEMAKLEASEGFISDAEAEKLDVNQPGYGDSALIGLQKGVTLGARPFVAGLGAGAGSALGTFSKLPDHMSFWNKVLESGKAAREGFSEGRSSAIEEQTAANNAHPVVSGAGEVLGSLLIPGIGKLGAAGAGALAGTGTAIGESEDLTDAAQKILGGAVLGKATQGAANLAGKGASALARSKLGQAISSGIGQFSDKAADFGAKTISKLSALPEHSVKAYLTKTDKIDDLIRQSSPGGKFNPLDLVDSSRQKISSAIDSTKSDLGSLIQRSIKSVPESKKASTSRINALLESAKANIDPDLNPEAISQVDEMLSRLSKKGSDVPADTLNNIKQFLQQRAKSSYLKNGQIFSNSKESAMAAKGAGAQARKLFNELVPEAGEANNKLSLLHRLDEDMNKNLLKQGAAPNAFLEAGRNPWSRSAKTLRTIEALTGHKALSDAEEAAAAEIFANPSLTPYGFTGKTLTNALSGATLGAGAATLAGEDWKKGATAGALATSPLATKLAIKAGKIPGKILSKAGSSTSRALMNLAKNPRAAAIAALLAEGE